MQIFLSWGERDVGRPRKGVTVDGVDSTDVAYCGSGALLAVEQLFLIAFRLRVELDCWYMGGICHQTFWILFLKVMKLYSP